MSAKDPQQIILGSRGSELARAQTAMVSAALREAWPQLAIEVSIIKTRGDHDRTPVDLRAGRKGLFTGEIERALAERKIDIAVHSAKDLPSDASPGLEVRGALPRAPFDDLLITKRAGGIFALPKNPKIATGSVRRQFQFRFKLPAVELLELRGNVPTRLRKLLTNDWDGIVLARAGLERLGHNVSEGEFEFEGKQLHAEILPHDDFLPAGGQGIIALQVQSEDESAKKLVDCINDAGTFLCLRAEREFLRLLQGDCDSPVGVLATISNETMKLRAQVFEPGQAASRTGAVEGSTNLDVEKLPAELMRQIYGG